MLEVSQNDVVGKCMVQGFGLRFRDRGSGYSK